MTKKIIATAARIAAGTEQGPLRLGDLEIRRDWGWAPDFVDAMWRMLQIDSPDDFVIATGFSHSLEKFVECVFEQLGLDWRDHVDIDANLFRPSDIATSAADPSKAERVLGWKSKTSFSDLIKKLIEAEMNRA